MNTPAQVFTGFRRFSHFIVLALLCQGLLLAGCSTRSALLEKQVKQQTDNQQLIQQVTNALEATEARFAKAQAADVGTYAPNQLASAEQALREARRFTERLQHDPDLARQSMSLFFGETMSDKTLGLIASANEALTQAEEHKQQADAIFAAVNENFIWLNKFQAPTYYPLEYRDLQRTRQDLLEDVASGDLNEAQQRLPQFLSEQRALEIVAAQRFYLHDLGLRVEREGRTRLERYATISYSSAAAALNKAKAVIAQDSRAEEKILQARTHAEFSLGIAHAVATDMQRLDNMDRQSRERWLILVATKLHKMGRAIGAQDVRDKELVQQLDLLARAAGNQGQTAAVAEPAAKSEPTTPAAPVAAASAPATASATASEGQAIDHRMTQLEQSLAEQIKMLSEQINAMQQVSVSTQAAPVAEVSAPSN